MSEPTAPLVRARSPWPDRLGKVRAPPRELLAREIGSELRAASLGAARHGDGGRPESHEHKSENASTHKPPNPPVLGPAEVGQMIRRPLAPA